MESLHTTDVIVVGSGISGLMTAICLYPRKVTLISKKKLGEASSSAWAQGGIAAAIGKDDSPKIHFEDTIKASSGLSDEKIVKIITDEAASIIKFLEEKGVNFDKDHLENFLMSQEAAHSRRRVLKVNGDSSGREIIKTLINNIQKLENITILEDVTIDEIITENNKVIGLIGRHVGKNVVDNFTFFKSPNIVLATGGLGSIYEHTTNPRDIYGEGIAMAARAGAVLCDMEFVQFHPTGMDVGLDPTPLLTEALRGDGAKLVDENDRQFMKSVHPNGDLAPRDIVARELKRLNDLGHSTFLDCRKFSNEKLETMFPSAYSFLKKANIDFTKEKIPVTPAAHYHMGGVLVDENGKSSIKGLWACGEVSSTGAHGANRLASNSLLEAFVFGKRIATSINNEAFNNADDKNINFQKYLPKEKTSSRIRAKKYIWQLRNIMSDLVGVYRNEQKLKKAFIEIDRIEREAKNLSAKLKDMILVSRLITYSAYLRKESRGAHFRSDYPTTDDKFLFRKQITLKELEKFLNKKEYIQKVA